MKQAEEAERRAKDKNVQLKKYYDDYVETLRHKHEGEKDVLLEQLKVSESEIRQLQVKIGEMGESLGVAARKEVELLQQVEKARKALRDQQEQLDGVHGENQKVWRNQIDEYRTEANALREKVLHPTRLRIRPHPSIDPPTPSIHSNPCTRFVHAVSSEGAVAGDGAPGGCQEAGGNGPAQAPCHRARGAGGVADRQARVRAGAAPDTAG